MNKVVTGLSVAGAAALFSLSTVSAAHAADDTTYPDTNPKSTEVQSGNVSGNNSAAAAALPNTGGPNDALLAGGAALLVAGGATIVVARRRQTS